MSSNFYSVGLNHVGAYQVSGTPFFERSALPATPDDSLQFQFPKDGVIKVFNERDFKLAICSRDVSQKFLDYAEERNCPVEILDPVTQENLEELENQCREIQKFWNSGN